MKIRFAAAVAAFFISSSAQAIVFVQNSELPTAMQGNFGSMVVSSFNTTNMAAFGYMENSVAKWLIRYNVLPPSSQAGQPLGGAIWLSANNAYDLTNNSHNLTLYTDRITPTPSNYDYFLWGGPNIGLTLNSSGLLSGGGNFQIGLDWNNQSYSTGSLTVSNGAAICVAEGCNVSTQLNLIDLKYLNSGNTATLNFDASDNRSLLFKQASYDPYCNNMSGCLTQQQFNVQPIPLPAGLWLLASGLMGLGTLARKKQLRH